MIPTDPVTASLVILSAAVTGLGALLANVVRSLLNGTLVPVKTLTDERAISKRLLDESRDLASLERTRADLAVTQLEVALEQGRTTVAFLHSLDRRAAQAEEVAGVVERTPRGS